MEKVPCEAMEKDKVDAMTCIPWDDGQGHLDYALVLVGLYEPYGFYIVMDLYGLYMHFYALVWTLCTCYMSSFDSMHLLYVVEVLHILLLWIISYILNCMQGIMKNSKNRKIEVSLSCVCAHGKGHLFTLPCAYTRQRSYMSPACAPGRGSGRVGGAFPVQAGGRAHSKAWYHGTWQAHGKALMHGNASGAQQSLGARQRNCAHDKVCLHGRARDAR
jgi:hypothetical protein